jgi:hypothetical protein
VLVDTAGGNNMLYLPLDQLTQRRNDSRSTVPGSSLSMSDSREPMDSGSGAGSTSPRR